MKAELIEYFKQDIRGRYVMEVRVWQVEDKRYKYGLKYSLIFLEYKTGKKVLMDNHHPKDPHVHIDDNELSYEFSGVEKLMTDFRNLIFKQFGEKV